jgi:hypothetical protein
MVGSKTLSTFTSVVGNGGVRVVVSWRQLLVKSGMRCKGWSLRMHLVLCDSRHLSIVCAGCVVLCLTLCVCVALAAECC